MTRKDYQLIARAVHKTAHFAKRFKQKEAEMAALSIVHDLAAALEADNPNFKREKFIDACIDGE